MVKPLESGPGDRPRLTDEDTVAAHGKPDDRAGDERQSSTTSLLTEKQSSKRRSISSTLRFKYGWRKPRRATPGSGATGKGQKLRSLRPKVTSLKGQSCRQHHHLERDASIDRVARPMAVDGDSRRPYQTKCNRHVETGNRQSQSCCPRKQAIQQKLQELEGFGVETDWSEGMRRSRGANRRP